MTIVGRTQLRYGAENSSHPQYAVTRPNRWNEIDFSTAQEIPGKGIIPALPGACAVIVSAQVGITRGMIPGENIAIWLDFTADPASEPCRESYSDSANYATGIRDSTGSWPVPLRDGKMWWTWCANSNIDPVTGAFVAGPNISSPKARLRPPYSTGFVNLGLLGWVGGEK